MIRVVPPSLLLKTAITGLPVEVYVPLSGFLFQAPPVIAGVKCSIEKYIKRLIGLQ